MKAPFPLANATSASSSRITRVKFLVLFLSPVVVVAVEKRRNSKPSSSRVSKPLGSTSVAFLGVGALASSLGSEGVGGVRGFVMGP